MTSCSRRGPSRASVAACGAFAVVLLICCGAPLLGIVGVLLGALVNSLLIMIGSAAVIAVSALVALLHRRRAKTGREG